MFFRGFFRRGLGVACALVLLSACFGGGKTDDSERFITVYSEKLNDPFMPSMANHYYSTNVAGLVFAGLVYTDEQGDPVYDVAKSIESADKLVWNITLREDSYFTNGEQVTAESFVRAWNFTANIDNAQKFQDRFAVISGYEDGKQESLSGVRATGKFSMEVTLKQPNNEFLDMLSLLAFYPLPLEAYRDIESYQDNPFGNGPYKLKKWDRGVEVVLEKNSEYKGPRQPVNDGINFKIYSKDSAAYSDLLSGSLDLMPSLPVSALQTYEDDLGDRWSLRPTAVMETLVIPYDVPGFSGEEGRIRRQAISHGINRAQIADKIYRGTRTPAKAFMPEFFPAFDGENLSKVFEYDPQKAKDLWDKANQISPFNNKIELYYNSDGPYAQWFEAMASQLKESLGVEAEAVAAPSFRGMKEAALKNKQLLRLSYFPSYARPAASWLPMYFVGGSANWTGFDNPEFERLVLEAQSARNFEETKSKYNLAQDILERELPSVPVFFRKALSGWSQRLEKPSITWESTPVFHKLKIK